MTSTSSASEPATRADLEALRLELREDMAAQRAEFREDMTTQRAVFRQDMTELRADLRTWAATTIGLSAAILVGTIGAIVTVAFVG